LAVAERRAEEHVEAAEAPAVEEMGKAELNLHKVHSAGPRKCAATALQDCTCAESCGNEKTDNDACIGRQQCPEAALVGASD
jgi:hypothetical protein